MKDLDLDALGAVSGGLQLGALAQVQAVTPATSTGSPLGAQGLYGFDPNGFGVPFQPYGPYGAPAFDFNGCGPSSCSPCGPQDFFGQLGQLGVGQLGQLGQLGLGQLGQLGNLFQGATPQGLIPAGTQPGAGTLSVASPYGSTGYGLPGASPLGAPYGAYGASPLGSLF